MHTPIPIPAAIPIPVPIPTPAGARWSSDLDGSGRRSSYRARLARLAQLGTASVALAASHLAQDPASHHIYTFTGDAAADRFGASVAGAGDVDGDGFADVIAGAPHADGAGTSAGAVRVLGGADGAVLFDFAGAPASWFGAAVDGAGDLDGDGFADVIAGAPLGSPQTGTARAFSGRDGALLFFWSGDQAGDRFGSAVSAAGDVDADGFPDVVVGAPGGAAGGLMAGYARIFSGQGGAELATLHGAPGDALGTSVSAAGDADGDGAGEVLLGAPLADAGAFNGGGALVASRTGAVLFSFHGQAPGDQLGQVVRGAGDVDGDGRLDFALGVPGADLAGIDSGAAEVRSGADGSLLLLVAGAAEGDYLGAVAGAGDLDGDGLGELLVGSASSDAAATEAGSVRIVSGASGMDLAVFHGPEPFDWFGAAVAAAGDVNGDGRPDVAVGAPGHDDELTKHGFLRVLSASTLALASDLHALEAAAGGSQTLTLTAPIALAGLPYFLLGSAAGTTPGIVLAGLVLPLAYEPVYLPYTLAHPKSGRLDLEGRATVVLSVPPAPALAGLVLHHAYLVAAAGAFAFVSNATPIRLA